MPLKLSLDPQDRILLKQYIKENTGKWKISKRLEAIRLIDNGLSVTTVSKQLCINPEIIYKYIKIYEKKGIEGLIKFEKPGRESKLTEAQLKLIEEHIQECLEKEIKFTTKEQADWIKETFGVAIGPKWLYKRLLYRKHAHLGGIILFLGSCVSLIQEFNTIPGLKRSVFFTLMHGVRLSATLVKG